MMVRGRIGGRTRREGERGEGGGGKERIKRVECSRESTEERGRREGLFMDGGGTYAGQAVGERRLLSGKKKSCFAMARGGGGVIKGLIDYKEGEGRLEVGLWLQKEEEKKCWDDGKRKRK